MTDDFAGQHALHRQGITAAFCLAHARRKLFEVFELNSNKIAGRAVALIAKRCEIERKVKDLGNADRLLARQQRSKPVADAGHTWLTTQHWDRRQRPGRTERQPSALTANGQPRA